MPSLRTLVFHPNFFSNKGDMNCDGLEAFISCRHELVDEQIYYGTNLNKDKAATMLLKSTLEIILLPICIQLFIH